MTPYEVYSQYLEDVSLLQDRKTYPGQIETGELFFHNTLARSYYGKTIDLFITSVLHLVSVNDFQLQNTDKIILSVLCGLPKSSMCFSQACVSAISCESVFYAQTRFIIMCHSTQGLKTPFAKSAPSICRLCLWHQCMMSKWASMGAALLSAAQSLVPSFIEPQCQRM